MNSMANAFAAIVEAAQEKNKPRENDYIDAGDGLYHCGVCRRPKQKRQEFLGRIMVVPIMCRCREEEAAAMEADKRLSRISLLKREGFHDPALENSRFEFDDAPDSKASIACRRFSENFDEFLASGKGLVFTGSVGVGKTFYASCIANALMEKLHPVLVTSISRMIRGMEGDFGNRNETIDYLRRFDLVVFDDLGVERNTDYVNELVYAIIDGRVRSGKPMIITTNVGMDALRKTDGIPIGTARIYDRILSACIPIPFDGVNQRREKARTDYIKFRNILGI